MVPMMGYPCQSFRDEDINACVVSDVYENGKDSWMQQLFGFIQASNGWGCAKIVEGEGQIMVVNYISFEGEYLEFASLWCLFGEGANASYFIGNPL